MLVKRASADRGTADFGWLQAKHSFSFGNYYDPKYMGFRNLRVINEDIVTAGAGFDEHGHKDMEIITYVLDGAVAHKDNTGGAGIIKPGDVQVMSAGSGILHSEYNPNKNDALHMLQIWLLPRERGVMPRYDQRHFPLTDGPNSMQLLVSGDEDNENALFIHSDVKLYRGLLQAGQQLTHKHDANRFGWIQVARGNITVNGEHLTAGDGLAFGEENSLLFTALNDTEFLLFDLA